MRRLLFATLIVVAVAVAACGGAATPAQAPAAQPTTASAAQPTSAPAAQPTSAPAAQPTAMAQPTTAAAATAAPAAQLAPIVVPTAVPGMKGKLTMAGSSALLPLMQLASTNFQKANKDVQISVTAGGSGSGRSQVCKGQINIGNSDVQLSDKEKTDLNCADAVQTAVAIQAFGAVANKQGPGSVTSLSKAQLQDIFSGKTKNWKDVGGADQQIVLINRAKGSGTRANMAKYLFGGDDTKFATGASEEDNSETVLQTVKQTPGAVSYLGFAYLNNPDIVAFAIDNVQPTRADIQNGSWPIAAPGYSITKGAWNDLETAFLGYVISPGFQNSAEFAKLGFVPVPNPAQGK